MVCLFEAKLPPLLNHEHVRHPHVPAQVVETFIGAVVEVQADTCEEVNKREWHRFLDRKGSDLGRAGLSQGLSMGLESHEINAAHTVALSGSLLLASRCMQICKSCKYPVGVVGAVQEGERITMPRP